MNVSPHSHLDGHGHLAQLPGHVLDQLQVLGIKLGHDQNAIAGFDGLALGAGNLPVQAHDQDVACVRAGDRRGRPRR